MITLSLSKKQKLTRKLLDEPQIVDFLFGGGAGGGKSMLVCIWMFLQCRNYPGIRIGLGRKELTKLKQTTIVTLLREVHPLLSVPPSHFTYNEQKGSVSYINVSSIVLVDLAWQPSNPEYDQFGSLNFTHVVLEEVGEIQQKARNIFISRKNRFLNKKYNIVGKSISTCNPSQNYIKQDYYKPYKNLGGGGWQKWEHGYVVVNGERKTAYRAFIRSLVTDNPYSPPNYIEVLRNLPEAEKKRLLEGNWDYEDTDTMLFKSITLDRSLIGNIAAGKKFIGVDIGDVGSDKTILSLIEGDTLIEQKEIVVDKKEAVGEQIALEVIKYAQQNGITQRDARNIGIDVIGVGASTRDFLRSKGWFVKEFLAGGKSIGNFKNLRGETIYNMSIALGEGLFKIYDKLPTLGVLREQLMSHEYTTEERTIVIKSKDKIKEVLGVSPDYAESAYIGYWVAIGNKDPRHDSSRIVW